jgi:hypothetical protein
MPHYSLRNGIRKTVPDIQQGAQIAGNGMSVVMTGGIIPWVLRFWAFFGTHRSYVGAVRTFATQNSRVVAVCAMPGASSWEVEGRGATNAADEIELHLEAEDCRGGPFGVTALIGNSVEAGRSYRVLDGVSGPVVVEGEVYGWAAWAIAAGATVQAVAPPNLQAFMPLALGVPQNGSVRGNARGAISPVSAWTFTNTSQFMIEYFPPGIVFDG